MDGSDHTLRATILPHESFGAPECCGCLNGIIRGEHTDIVCNECGTVVRTVETTALEQTLAEIERTLEVASAMCPHCGAVNLFPGFSEMKAYICSECGQSLVVNLRRTRIASGKGYGWHCNSASA